MSSSVFLRMSDNSLHGVLSGVHVVFVDLILSCYGLSRVVPLRFDPLWCSLFVVFVIDVWLFGLLRFVRANVSARH